MLNDQGSLLFVPCSKTKETITAKICWIFTNAMVPCINMLIIYAAGNSQLTLCASVAQLICLKDTVYG